MAKEIGAGVDWWWPPVSLAEACTGNRGAGGGDLWRGSRARAVGRIPGEAGAKSGGGGFCGTAHNSMRLPSVGYSPYSPFPVVLGAQDGLSVDEVPPSLHDASGAANKNLQAKNADPQWLQIQGRALLWESTPSSLEKAEKDFEKARADGLATPSLEIDLAASYFERDSRAEHPNLQRTLNLLSEVLSKPNLSKDDQASALFNLAIAYEKTQAWDLAVETWEKYLQVDSTSGWTNEARQRLAAAKAKSSNMHRQSYSDPGFFLQQKAQGTLRPEDPEQYQQKALSQWLPIAVADKNSDAYRALNSLADVLSNEHSDQWMKAFLALMSPSETEGAKHLVRRSWPTNGGFMTLRFPNQRLRKKYLRPIRTCPGNCSRSFNGSTESEVFCWQSNAWCAQTHCGKHFLQPSIDGCRDRSHWKGRNAKIFLANWVNLIVIPR